MILFCILAVFAPAFTMGGIPGSLFLPLALAIGFSMIVSYFLSQTFVPVMANWIMKVKHHKRSEGDEIKETGGFDAALLAATTDTNNLGQNTVLIEKNSKKKKSITACFTCLQLSVTLLYICVCEYACTYTHDGS